MQRNPEFCEVFRNLYATGFSIGALLETLFWFFVGLIFSALLLLSVGYFGLGLLYVIFDLDPLDIGNPLPTGPKGINGIITLLILFLVTALFFGAVANMTLRPVMRRLFARLYVLAGRPLASVEGKPTLDPGDEAGYDGVEVGEFYFSFGDCWLDVKNKDLVKWGGHGVMRVWYIPTEIRMRNNPRIGKVVKHNRLLVRAEWRPLS